MTLWHNDTQVAWLLKITRFQPIIKVKIKYCLNLCLRFTYRFSFKIDSTISAGQRFPSWKLKFPVISIIDPQMSFLKRNSGSGHARRSIVESKFELVGDLKQLRRTYCNLQDGSNSQVYQQVRGSEPTLHVRNAFWDWVWTGMGLLENGCSCNKRSQRYARLRLRHAIVNCSLYLFYPF